MERIVSGGDLAEILNGYTPHGWSLHTLRDAGLGEWWVLLERDIEDSKRSARSPRISTYTSQRVYDGVRTEQPRKTPPPGPPAGSRIDVV